MNILRVIILFSVITGCYACTMAPAECDPSRSGFLTKVRASASGCYQARQRALSDSLDENRKINDALLVMKESLAEKQQQLKSQIVEESLNIEDLKSSWTALRSALTKKSNENATLKQQVDQLQKKIDLIDASDSSMHHAADRKMKEQQVKDLRKQVELLSIEINRETNFD